MVRASPVLVIYMAIKHLDLLVAKLRHAGLPDDRPAALVSHATLPQMRILTATLGSIVTRAQAAQVAPPALFVVGEVVDLPPVFGATDSKSAVMGQMLYV